MMINLKVEFNTVQRENLEKMTRFMISYNQKVNLTRIVEPVEIWEKHYVDSVLPLLLVDVPRGTSVIDVGTGAGFPAVPMKIYRPDLNFTLVDSLKKRIDYLELLKLEIGVQYNTVHGRSEQLSMKEEYRERFEIGISRAVANLAALAEYVLPFVKVGGMFLAMKGENDEAKQGSGAIDKLGGKIWKVAEYKLPGGDKRSLVVIKKIAKTEMKYPRQRVNLSKFPIA